MIPEHEFPEKINSPQLAAHLPHRMFERMLYRSDGEKLQNISTFDNRVIKRHASIRLRENFRYFFNGIL
jgi:hypothetical protein